MTSQSPRIYTYKITFEEVPYYYYGVHKEKRFDEEYWGSPVAHKWCWNSYTPKKKILEIFEYNDDGYLEAQEVEKRIIKPILNNKWCLNENVGGLISIEGCKKGGRIMGTRATELGLGIHGLSKKQRIENGKKAGKIGGKIGGEKTKKLGVGIFNRSEEQKILDSLNGGIKAKEMRLGIHALTDEQRSENGKRAGEKQRDLKIGVHGRTKEQKIEDGRKGGKIGGIKGGKIAAENLNSQKWKCKITGYISTPAGLSHYQKTRSIDKSLRERVS